MNEQTLQNLIDLANAHIEGRLDTDQQAELETLIASDPEARRIFADFMHDHAAMHWDQISETDNGGGEILDFVLDEENQNRSVSTLIWAVAAAIAFSAVGWFAFGMKRETGEVLTFATMEKTSAARWESGELPTAKGARLGVGKLRLAEGLATLRFDSGAEVILEAPVEIQLVDQMHCILTSGTAVADIPKSAIGFQINTPSANVVDYGTRFAVNVDEQSGATKTQVFEGLVEVEHPDSGKIVKLEAGEHNVVAGSQISDAVAGPDEGDWSSEAKTGELGPEWTLLEADRDAYVYSVDVSDHHSDVLLLLKNSRDSKGPHRKAFLGFDLRSVDLKKVADAELILNFAPTGWGLASRVPDAEFSVYGITDSASDDWNDGSMTWENAPANDPQSGNRLRSGKALKLGSFSVEQGVQRGQFGISGEKLAQFLQNDADGFISLAVVRETLEIGGGGLVHGIASRRHPVLPAPALAIRVAD